MSRLMLRIGRPAGAAGIEDYAPATFGQGRLGGHSAVVGGQGGAKRRELLSGFETSEAPQGCWHSAAASIVIVAVAAARVRGRWIANSAYSPTRLSTAAVALVELPLERRNGLPQIG